MLPRIPQLIDISAQWPSRYWGGPVYLHADGSYAAGQNIGTCKIGEVIAIDPDYPLYAHWTGRGWRYSHTDQPVNIFARPTLLIAHG